MSGTTINVCGNIMLKSVKMHFSGYTGIFGVLKSPHIFTGFKIHFEFKTGTLGIVKDDFSQKEGKI